MLATPCRIIESHQIFGRYPAHETIDNLYFTITGIVNSYCLVLTRHDAVYHRLGLVMPLIHFGILTMLEFQMLVLRIFSLEVCGRLTMRRREAAEQVDERTRQEIHTSFSEDQRLVSHSPGLSSPSPSPGCPGSLVDRVRLSKWGRRGLLRSAA